MLPTPGIPFEHTQWGNVLGYLQKLRSEFKDDSVKTEILENYAVLLAYEDLEHSPVVELIGEKVYEDTWDLINAAILGMLFFFRMRFILDRKGRTC